MMLQRLCSSDQSVERVRKVTLDFHGSYNSDDCDRSPVKVQSKGYGMGSANMHGLVKD